MRRTTAAVMIGAAFVFSGCGVEIGAHGGAAWTSRSPSSDDPNWTFGNRIGATTVLGRTQGVLVGGEIEGRAEQATGGRWTGGLLLGYSHLPRLRPYSVGFDVYADFGSKIDDASMFNYGQSYGGAAIALPIWLSGAHEGADLNAGTWLATRVVELVPYLRARFYDDRFADETRHLRGEGVAGVALRARWVSDLF